MFAKTNVLVFVFKFFSYNQTDNPPLSSTVKYITRINIMLQQRPSSPPILSPSPGFTSLCPTCLPPSACQLTDTQTDKQRSVEMQVVVESHTPTSRAQPGEARIILSTRQTYDRINCMLNVQTKLWLDECRKSKLLWTL